MLEGVPRQLFCTPQSVPQTLESAIQQNQLMLQSNIREIPTFSDSLLGVLELRRFIVVVGTMLRG